MNHTHLVRGLALMMVLALASTVGAATRNSTIRLFGSDVMTGMAKYQQKSRHGERDDRFRVHVSRALPFQQLEVQVNGVLVGVAVANAGGSARLDLRSRPRGQSGQLPADFPVLQCGDVVTVGPLVGVCFPDNKTRRYELEGEVDVGETEYEASYRERSCNGALKRTFEAEIDDGEANQSVPVFVNDAFVGTITTDASGDGELEFRTGADADDDTLPMPADFPSLQAGDVVRIGNAVITLSVASDDDDDDDDDGDDDDD